MKPKYYFFRHSKTSLTDFIVDTVGIALLLSILMGMTFVGLMIFGT